MSEEQEQIMNQVNEEKNIGNMSADRKTEHGAGSELNVLVAERVMGQKVGRLKRDPKQENPFDDYTPYRNNRTGELMSGTMYSEGMAVVGRFPVPRYSTEIAAAMRVENRIAELGKQNDYIAHLWDEVGAARDGSNFWTAQNFNAFWLCVHATPEQRCRAALKATECLLNNNHSNDGQASET